MNFIRAVPYTAITTITLATCLLGGATEIHAAITENGHTQRQACLTDVEDSTSPSDAPSEGSSVSNDSSPYKDVNVDYNDNTTPIGATNAKKLAKATAEAASKAYGVKVDPGLIYAQWAQEAGSSFNASPNLNGEGHNLGGLSAPVPDWLASKGAKTGSAHAEGDGSYIYFPNYKTFAEAYISGYYKAVPEALKAGSKSGESDADVTQFVTVLKQHGYFTADVSTYATNVKSLYAMYYNASDIADASENATKTTDEPSDDACEVENNTADSSNIAENAESMVGYFVGHYMQSHNPSLVSDEDEGKEWSVSDINKEGYTDCSGFVWTVLKVSGYKVPPGMAWNTLTMADDAKGQKQYLKEIDKSNAKVGTIVTAGGTGNAGHTVILAEDWHGDETLCYSMGSDEGVVKREYKYVMARHPADSATFCVPSSDSSKTNSSSNTTSSNSSSDEAARKWIIQKESGGRVNATNGRFYGLYQLDLAYLNGDLSESNQHKTAESYMKSRYGSWTKAKEFWENHNWW